MNSTPAYAYTRDFMHGVTQKKPARFLPPSERMENLAKTIRIHGPLPMAEAARIAGFPVRAMVNALATCTTWFPIYEDENEKGKIIVGWNEGIDWPFKGAGDDA